MVGLSISLFGRFCIQFNGQEITNTESHKIQELLSYLLLFRENPHSRESLANLLWSDVPTTKSKSYLRKTLWQLQSALDSEDLPGEPNVLLVDPEWVQINTTAALWLDVAEIEHAFYLTHGVPGEKIDFETFEKLQRTVDLYRGDLLEGWYQEWCLRERERLQSIFLILLDKLMSYCEANGNYEDGLVHGMRILHFDQARERTHRSLMRLYYQGGYRTEALRQYHRCVEILDMELGVQPSKQTTTLYEQIRSDGFFATTAVSSINTGNNGMNESPLGDVLTSLISLQKDLSSIQDQLRQKIETVEKLLTH